MPKVEFENTDRFTSRRIFGTSTTPKMVKVVMKMFRLENEKYAGEVLLFSSLFCILLSFAILYFALKTPSFKPARANDNLPKSVRMALPPKYNGK